MENMNEMMNMPQSKRAELKSVRVENDMHIGAEEAFDIQVASDRVKKLEEEIPQLQASIDKQEGDRQKALAVAEKLNARPELVSKLSEEAQAVIDDMKLEKMRLEREKEGLEARLKM